LSKDVANLTSLENLGLFENNLDGQVPFDLEKISGLKELNLSYNKFNGLVSRQLAQLDTMHMTMINDEGVATTLQVDKGNSAIATEE
jgi:hypothetical protein